MFGRRNRRDTEVGGRVGTKPRRPRQSRCTVEVLEDRQLLTGDVAVKAVVPLTATISPKQDPSNQGVIYKPLVQIVGTTAPGAKVQVSHVGGKVLRTVHADATGHYRASINCVPGRTPLHVTATDTTGGTGAADLTVTRGDVIIAWNTTTLNTIRAESLGPTVASRAMAMVQTAVYDAVEAVTHDHAPYAVQVKATPGTSAAAAASQAACRVLSNLFPDRAAIFQATSDAALASIPGARGKSLGVDLGNQVADAILALRANDGSSVKVNYQPGTTPGSWVPTPPKFLAPLTPQWGQVTPFALPSANAFMPGPPPALDSAQYIADYNQVKDLGSVNSTTRTADQTALAHFWSDLSGVSFTPPGHWNQVAQDASFTKHMKLADEARMFAKLDVALADAAIVCWDTKYTYNYWRPVTAIRQAASLKNPQLVADPNWTPLWTTPNFPSYDSGHSTFSGAAQVVLESFFGTNFTFTDNGDPNLHLAPRQFTSFKQAADEAGFSRIAGGIHFQFDNTAGLSSGRQIGQYVVQHVAQ